MNVNGRLSDEEYEKLSLEYAQKPPRLSGKSGFFTAMRERALIAGQLENPKGFSRRGECRAPLKAALTVLHSQSHTEGVQAGFTRCFKTP
ncbi:MAG: hypothetical protein FWH02_04990 [Oscillospiraceae bacterium]|nr:hypothetical protein [Oscillospiraceae bacterium]